MKARTLIESAAYDPSQLKILGAAFDAAWAQIAPSVRAHPDAREAARMKLATIVLQMAIDVAPLDAERIKERALQLIFAEPVEMRPFN